MWLETKKSHNCGTTARAMDSLYDPPDTLLLAEYFGAIGQMTNNVDAWTNFFRAVVSISAASSVGLLKRMRDADVDMALHAAHLSLGYKLALQEYLSPTGKPPFSFAGAVQPLVTESKTFAKKIESQKMRPTLGSELGATELLTLELPAHLFDGIKYSPTTAMPAKGKHGTEAVANLVWAWVVSRWGNLHVDQQFCDHMDDLLSARFPNLKPWSGKPRSWATIIKNRFANARSSSSEAYKTCSIPSVDLSSPAKRLLQDKNFNLRVDESARSLFSQTCEPSANMPAPFTIPTGTPVEPFDGANLANAPDNFFNHGIRVAQGTPAFAAAASAAALASGSDARTAEPRDAPAAAAAAADSSVDVQPPAAAVAADSSDEEQPPAAATAAASLRRRRSSDDEPAPAAQADSSDEDSSDEEPMPRKQPAIAARAAKKSKPPPPAFAECDLSLHWTYVQPDDAEKIGKDLTDVNGMGDPDLAVIKQFPVKDGGNDWYLANINRELVRKNFFWVTFVDDLAEYRIPFFPKQYGKQWAFVMKKPCPSPSY